MSTKPTHAPILFPVVDGELQIGGIPVSRLAARVGQTPFYAYDRQLLSRRVAELRATLQRIVAFNLGALGLSALGLMLVVLGIVLG